MPPRAIETRYSGCRFRSRLEARWAVYLNAIKAKWVYEPEGFVLSDGAHYLPDFFVYHHGSATGGFWLEVKAVEPSGEEVAKMRALCAESGHAGFIAEGKFPDPTMHLFPSDPRKVLSPENQRLRGPSYLLSMAAPTNLGLDAYHAACVAAAEARFEHGERSAV